MTSTQTVNNKQLFTFYYKANGRYVRTIANECTHDAVDAVPACCAHIRACPAALLVGSDPTKAVLEKVEKQTSVSPLWFFVGENCSC